MGVRKSDSFLVFLAVSLVLFVLIILHASLNHLESDADTVARKQMVHDLGLTDLCLFTEARYTRHPAMADMNTAFQDHPVALEHFPSGAILQPPEHLRRYGMD